MKERGRARGGWVMMQRGDDGEVREEYRGRLAGCQREDAVHAVHAVHTVHAVHAVRG